eukprot:TRINITY_DN4177_c0_g1_i1.p1 TRINITY_DN4177_c0_g1~~TRINITY_DN4177_c0_g1_i1.p1  ORF type:complete len:354 (-),score=30.44 TRINITY_DN4177_c0_g1_i1:44-1105(-)
MACGLVLSVFFFALLAHIVACVVVCGVLVTQILHVFAAEIFLFWLGLEASFLGLVVLVWFLTRKNQKQEQAAQAASETAGANQVGPSTPLVQRDVVHSGTERCLLGLIVFYAVAAPCFTFGIFLQQQDLRLRVPYYHCSPEATASVIVESPCPGDDFTVVPVTSAGFSITQWNVQEARIVFVAPSLPPNTTYLDLMYEFHTSCTVSKPQGATLQIPGLFACTVAEYVTADCQPVSTATVDHMGLYGCVIFPVGYFLFAAEIAAALWMARGDKPQIRFALLAVFVLCTVVGAIGIGLNSQILPLAAWFLIWFPAVTCAGFVGFTVVVFARVKNAKNKAVRTDWEAVVTRQPRLL